MKKFNYLLWIAASFLFIWMTSCNKTNSFNSIKPKEDSVNAITLIAHAKIKLGGSDSVLLNRAYGLAANVPYSYAAITGGVGNIDLIFDQGKFWNEDPVTNSTATFTGSKFLLTSLTSDQFDAVTTKAQLDAYGLKATDDTADLAEGKIIFVHTKEGYDCLIRINLLFPPSGSVTFDYKIAVRK